MTRWISILALSVLTIACGNTDQTTSDKQGNGGEKIEGDYHLEVQFLSYNPEEKTYELQVDDIISIPAAPIEIIAVGDVLNATDHDNTNQLRNKVLTNAPNEPFEVWISGRPSMTGTDWVIRKYKIE